jgi:hypothetical protein
MPEEQPPFESVPYAAFARPLSPRPTSVTVIAVLAIVFGSFGLLAALCTLPTIILNRSGAGPFASLNTNFTTTVTSTATTNPATGTTSTTSVQSVSNPMFPTYTREPAFIIYSVINTLVGLILAIIALWAGIGLLKLQPAARTWIMRYAVVDMIAIVVGMAYSIIVLQPKIVAAMQAMQQNNPAAANLSAFTSIGVYIGYAFNLAWIAWPATVVYIMSRPHVKAALAVAPAAH